VPVVVGVGHESDFTIADFAADARAATPTAAAALACPSRDELIAQVAGSAQRLSREMRPHPAYAAQKLHRGAPPPPPPAAAARAPRSRGAARRAPRLRVPPPPARLRGEARAALRRARRAGPAGGARARLQHYLRRFGRGAARRSPRARWRAAAHDARARDD